MAPQYISKLNGRVLFGTYRLLDVLQDEHDWPGDYLTTELWRKVAEYARPGTNISQVMVPFKRIRCMETVAKYGRGSITRVERIEVPTRGSTHVKPVTKKMVRTWLADIDVSAQRDLLVKMAANAVESQEPEPEPTDEPEPEANAPHKEQEPPEPVRQIDDVIVEILRERTVPANGHREVADMILEDLPDDLVLALARTALMRELPSIKDAAEQRRMRLRKKLEEIREQEAELEREITQTDGLLEQIDEL